MVQGFLDLAPNTITIDWSSNLGGSTDYFINIDNNAFTNNNATINYAGINDTTSLNFSTILKPSLSSSTPSDDGSGVYLNSISILSLMKMLFKERETLFSIKVQTIQSLKA